ncbi:MAG: hypothetical protein ACOC22_00045 [bacterium]
MKNTKQQGIYAIPNKVKSLFSKFISWVLHIYPSVGGQFKKRHRSSQVFYGNPLIQFRWTDEVQHKLRCEQTMTYIVTGKFNNNTFLMVDCVGTNPSGEHRFLNKLNKLKSTDSETYSTITGYDAFQYAINFFDKKCHEDNRVFDIENRDHILEVLEIYDLLKNNKEYTKGHDIEKNFDYSGLFFINKDKIIWYKISRDENKNLEISMTSIIDNNSISEDFYTILIKDNQFKNTNEIIDYCKTAIKKHYKRKNETKNLDLKDRFSFIMFNNDEKTTKILPYSNNKGFILSEISCNYNELE